MARIEIAIDVVTKLLSKMADVKITPPPLTKDGGVVICPEGGGTDWLSLNNRHARCFANVSLSCKASSAEAAFNIAARLSECVSQGNFTGFCANEAVQILSVQVLSAPQLISRADDWIYSVRLRINYFY